jgi:hypothetical protein
VRTHIIEQPSSKGFPLCNHKVILEPCDHGLLHFCHKVDAFFFSFLFSLWIDLFGMGGGVLSANEPSLFYKEIQ